jgi:redox-sensitive bicupin YhaK (pirin superfamily)
MSLNIRYSRAAYHVRMVNVIPSNARHHADHGWLSTYWHFSFSDYYDPENMNWGALRVFNDDVIKGAGGFGDHPHRDMEIITYVLEGELEHQDNLGNKGVIRPGEVQVMSAGKGIVHAEYNHSQTASVHLLQLWVMPRNRGQKPRWEQRQYSPKQREGKLLAVVSSGNVPDTLHIDQDAVIYIGTLKAGQEMQQSIARNRKGYLFAISGALSVNDKKLAAGDQARIEDEENLRLKADQPSELIYLDLPDV